MDSAHPKRSVSFADQEEFPLSAATRPATESDNFGYGTTSSSSSSILTMSMTDLSQALINAATPCRFCGAQIVGTPFNSRQLMHVMVSNERAIHGELPPLEDDDDDDDTGDRVMQGVTHEPMQLSLVERMLSTPLKCCSDRCWMAETLARQGEQSVFGRALARYFPYLMPERVGEPVLSIYRKKAAELQQQMIQRSLIRLQMLQSQPQRPSVSDQTNFDSASDMDH